MRMLMLITALCAAVGCAGGNRCTNVVTGVQHQVDDLRHDLYDMCALAMQVQMGGAVMYAGGSKWVRHDGAVAIVDEDDFMKQCGELLDLFNKEVAETAELVDDSRQPLQAEVEVIDDEGDEDTE